MEMNFFELDSYIKLGELDQHLQTEVKNIYDAVEPIINDIPACYTNYTLHNIEHSLRVICYMEKIAFHSSTNVTIDNFNALEIAIMLLTGLLHDIGMFIDDKDKENIPCNKIEYNHDELTYEGMLSVCGDRDSAIKEIVRKNHAARVEKYIKTPINGAPSIISRMKVDNIYDFGEDVIQICKSHGEDFSFIAKNLKPSVTKGKYNYNQQYIAVLLRLADYLDFDKRRTPILWFNIFDIKGFSHDEWEKHFCIENDKKFQIHYSGKQQIFFQGSSKDPNIHRKYLAYIDSIKKELDNADRLLNGGSVDQRHRLYIATDIADMVETIGFECSDLRLGLDYSSITELLMGRNIYGDSKYGLRELIQNSIDACKLAEEIVKGNLEDSKPSIYIITSKENNYVKIKDTGVGMSLDIIKKHFLNIGKSYYKSNEYAYKNYRYKPIGQFGIGFLACFLLSDEVTVTTKYYNQPDINKIELTKQSEYVVTKKDTDNHNFKGTEIQLNYNQFFKVFSSKEDVVLFVKTNFMTNVDIYYVDADSKEGKELINENTSDEEIAKIYGVSKEFELINVNKKNFATGKLFCKKINIRGKQIIEIIDFTDVDIFLYDKKDNVFKKKTNIQTGYYFYIKYTQISSRTYKRLLETSNTDRKFQNNIINNQNYKKTILLFKNTDYDFLEALQGIDDTKDLKTYISVFKKSGLTFYKEIFEKYVFLGKLFFYDNSGIIVFGQYVTQKYRGYSIYRYNLFSVLYKDVLVRDAEIVLRDMPFQVLIRGYINYLCNDLKLDVSRRKIINGSTKISSLLKEILINDYLLNSKKGNEAIKKMLDYDKNH